MAAQSTRGIGTRRIAVTIVATLAVVATLGACKASTPKVTRALEVVGTEMAFTAPDRVPTGHYRVTFRNQGTVYHELAFKDPAGEIQMRRSIEAGQTVVIEVDLTRPGTWELACYEPGHYEAGMHRPLTVVTSS